MKYDGQDVVAYDFIGLTMPAVVSYVEPDVELNYALAHNASYTEGVYPGYDRFGRISRQKWLDGDYGYLGPHFTQGGRPSIPPIVELTFTYDKASNILEKYDARPGAKQSLNHQYVYDDLDRLIEAKRGSGSGGWNTIGYCGYVFNPEVPTTGGGGGLYTVRFRHYDAELGRWLERDVSGTTRSIRVVSRCIRKAASTSHLMSMDIAVQHGRCLTGREIGWGHIMKI